MTFYLFHRGRVCLVDPVDLICRLYSCWEGFGSSSLATLPLCICEGQVWMWCSCLRCKGSGSTRYSRELAARAAGNVVLQKSMATSIGQYAPVFLPGEPLP